MEQKNVFCKVRLSRRERVEIYPFSLTVFLFLVFLVVPLPAETVLTFDNDGLFSGDKLVDCVPVYGDRCAASGTILGSTVDYYYGGACDTQNIQVGYQIVEQGGDHTWWGTSPRFYETQNDDNHFGFLENFVSLTGGRMIAIMLKPDPGYFVNVESIVCSAAHDTWTNIDQWRTDPVPNQVYVEIWESIGSALDMNDITGYPAFIEGDDYNILYSSSESGFSEYFDVNVSSSEIVWIVTYVGETGDSYADVAVDDIIFSQGEGEIIHYPETCEEYWLWDENQGKAEDINRDCKIDMKDVRKMAEQWTNSTEPNF